ncbi:hypothetical protein [Pseudonocardia acaciae]|uniref:hypothetical protein n=1 Tax=Pseudonocardia acaciae TaxID=551276 RepID=UPI0012EE76A0|nr:hypothetical protein [Pseudonocardia acaciae]
MQTADERALDDFPSEQTVRLAATRHPLPASRCETSNIGPGLGVIDNGTRCGPAPDWGSAVLQYWLAKRRGERTLRRARRRG